MSSIKFLQMLLIAEFRQIYCVVITAFVKSVPLRVVRCLCAWSGIISWPCPVCWLVGSPPGFHPIGCSDLRVGVVGDSSTPDWLVRQLQSAPATVCASYTSRAALQQNGCSAQREKSGSWLHVLQRTRVRLNFPKLPEDINYAFQNGRKEF